MFFGYYCCYYNVFNVGEALNVRDMWEKERERV